MEDSATSDESPSCSSTPREPSQELPCCSTSTQEFLTHCQPQDLSCRSSQESPTHNPSEGMSAGSSSQEIACTPTVGIFTVSSSQEIACTPSADTSCSSKETLTCNSSEEEISLDQLANILLAEEGILIHRPPRLSRTNKCMTAR